MQRFFGIAQDINGNAIPSTTITVRLAGTVTDATLYSDNAYTPQVNPFTSATDGTYQFYARDGRYDIVLAKTGFVFNAAETADTELLDRSSVLTPPQITANQNDYAPTNGLNASVWRLTSDAPRTITGIAAGYAQQALTVLNVGSFAITLSNLGGASVPANRIITGSGADVALNAAGVATLVYDSVTTMWRITGIVAGSVSSVFTMSPGTITGLTLSNDVTNPTRDIAITVGAAASDDAVLANRTAISVATALIKNTSTNWAAGTNQGCLDTGLVGNGTYHIFAILNTSSGATDILSSLSPTAPSLPAGYDKQRRIGAILREAGAVVAFVQDGDLFQRKTGVMDVNAANPGTNAVTRTLSVPTGVRVVARFIAIVVDTTPGATNAYLSDLDLTDEASSGIGTPGHNVSHPSVDANNYGVELYIRTNTSAQIRSRLGASNANTTLRIMTHGWVDTRDKDK